MKKFICLVAIFIFILNFISIGAYAENDEKSYSWYCVRRSDHKQPSCDSSMRFIEEYNGYYLDKNHGDSSDDKVVYLTFDAGYENGNISLILDTLKDENVHGAFFVLSNLIYKEPELMKRMVQDGHTICNHTSRHKDMSLIKDIEAFKAELEALEKVYFEQTGFKMSKYYRPPEGKFSRLNLKMANELGYKTIFWSFAYADWDNNKQMSEEAAKEKILSNIHNGAVLLLHPTSATNAKILGDVIRTLKNDGYRFGTLDELTQK